MLTSVKNKALATIMVLFTGTMVAQTATAMGVSSDWKRTPTDRAFFHPVFAEKAEQFGRPPAFFSRERTGHSGDALSSILQHLEGNRAKFVARLLERSARVTRIADRDMAGGGWGRNGIRELRHIMLLNCARGDNCRIPQEQLRTEINTGGDGSNVVPIPGAVWLLVSACLPLAAFRRRRKASIDEA